MGRVGIKGQFLGFSMLKPCVSDTQVMVPAKIIELEVIIVFSKILLRIRNTVGSDDVGTSFSPLTGTRICIHEYDLSLRLIVVREGLGEGGVEVLPIMFAWGAWAT